MVELTMLSGCDTWEGGSGVSKQAGEVHHWSTKCTRWEAGLERPSNLLCPSQSEAPQTDLARQAARFSA